ncbi:globin [Mycolicibacterium aurum]|uniref:Globin n=1 Tax=Mycolicibacterium aurum TaxID=1791 RepID=A0A3S4RTM2_MYCAU|nr:group 1 truncated hemoglobin [Mycolicibacterium aurum]VEG55160.1 globin [Mycolicibacterium aurum]
MSMFDQIGGRPAVTAAVDDLYRRVIADPALSQYVDGIDMKALKSHQRSFIAAAIGEPDPYLGAVTREGYAYSNIRPEHFDRVVEHLIDTLSDLGVSPSVIEAVGARLAPLPAEVVSPGTSARAS